MPSIYSIRDLENLSGIKAHTIRIWEQRYGILNANRTETNIRYYSEAELRYLMSLALLNRSGFKISKLAVLSQPEISKLVTDKINAPTEYTLQIEGLTLATIEYDEEKFEKILNTCILQIGFEETIKRVVFQYLEKLGMLWISGTIMAAQEHFMTQLLRQKLLVAIDGQNTKYDEHSKEFVLFLPNGEWHELSLLFLSYMLKARNHKVIYLGPSVPLQDLLRVGETLSPDGFYTIITTNPTTFTIADYLNKIGSAFPESKIFVSGPQVANPIKGLVDNVYPLSSMESAVSSLEQLASA
jgi:MerR family transcriptional regulator, light-induced transcriptional regulator